ncbi:hypothetical protein U1Q18_022636 [Sarracenia purpurea var. burkii]
MLLQCCFRGVWMGAARKPNGGSNLATNLPGGETSGGLDALSMVFPWWFDDSGKTVKWMKKIRRQSYLYSGAGAGSG